MFKQGQRSSIRMHLENVLYAHVDFQHNTIEDMNQLKAVFNKLVDDCIVENQMQCEPGGVSIKRIDDLGRINIPVEIRAAMSPTGNHRDLDLCAVDIVKIVDPDTNEIGFKVMLHKEDN